MENRYPGRSSRLSSTTPAGREFGALMSCSPLVAPAAPMSEVAGARRSRPHRRRGRPGRRRPRRGRAARRRPCTRRYFHGALPRPTPRAAGLSAPRRGRRGGEFCRAAGRRPAPEFLRRAAGSAYRIAAGRSRLRRRQRTPRRRPPRAASSTSRPATAPEVFARLVGALDGYGLGFRAELAGDPAACRRADSAVVTVAAGDASTVARVALRLQQRTRSPSPPRCRLHPRVGAGRRARRRAGAGPARTFGRHRCRLVAAGLVAAGPAPAPGQRRAAVLRALDRRRARPRRRCT